MDKLLKIDSFSLSLGPSGARQEILRDINLELDSGSILSLVGQSGSGKSMLAKAILSLNEQLPHCHTEGQIWFRTGGDRLDLTQGDEKLLRYIRNKEIGIVFQQSKEILNPAFRLGNQILERLTLQNPLSVDEARTKVLSTLSEVDLNPADRFFEAYPHQLSGGQIQRGLIALALINDPIFLIADEPSSALDQAIRKGIIDLLKKLNTERGLTILLISHNLRLVSSISDDIAIILDGHIIEKGPARSLLTHPENPYTKSLLACQPPSGKKYHRLATLEDFMVDSSIDMGSFYEEQTQSFNDIENRRNQINNSKILLKVKNLTKQYLRDNKIFSNESDVVEVFREISFNIKKGEIFGLLGPSGSGKSTLARIIAGLERQDKGVIKFNGKNTRRFSIKDNSDYRRRVQYIFQDPMSAMAPHLRVDDILNESLSVNAEENREETVESLLRKVGLDPLFAAKLPRQMSGGERQRILIARALAFKPELLICDEILSALDVSSQAQIINVLLSLNREEGITILFITHDEPILRFMADNILYLHS